MLGLLTFLAALLIFMLAVSARDICDSTCNQGAAHLWAVLSKTAIVSSIVQVFAAIGGSRRVALCAFAMTLVIAGILFLPLIFA